MEFQEVVDGVVEMCVGILGTDLTGVYLHGSMAMGGFHVDKSDIDLIVVVESDMADVQKMDFMKGVVRLNERGPAKGLEISVVKREVCKPFVYPTPFELHFSKIHLQAFLDNPDNYISGMKGLDWDLAAHFTVIGRYGITLIGKEISDVFGMVPEEDYVDSIWRDVKNARKEIVNDPVYFTLNLCRVLAFLRENLCLSKEKGGEWGLENMAEEYRPLVRQALEAYRTGKDMQAEEVMAVRFADYALAEIGERRGKAGKYYVIGEKDVSVV